MLYSCWVCHTIILTRYLHIKYKYVKVKNNNSTLLIFDWNADEVFPKTTITDVCLTLFAYQDSVNKIYYLTMTPSPKIRLSHFHTVPIYLSVINFMDDLLKQSRPTPTPSTQVVDHHMKITEVKCNLLYHEPYLVVY